MCIVYVFMYSLHIYVQYVYMYSIYICVYTIYIYIFTQVSGKQMLHKL